MPKNTDYPPIRIKSLIKSNKSKIALQIQNNFGPWLKKVSKKILIHALRPKSSVVQDLKLLGSYLRRNLWFSTQWTFWKRLTTSWLVKFGSRSKKQAFCIKFSLHSSRSEKWNLKQNTQPILKQTLSQLPSKKLSTLTVFQDINKSTQPFTQFQFSHFCLVSCSVISDMVV